MCSHLYLLPHLADLHDNWANFMCLVKWLLLCLYLKLHVNHRLSILCLDIYLLLKHICLQFFQHSCDRLQTYRFTSKEPFFFQDKKFFISQDISTPIAIGQ